MDLASDCSGDQHRAGYLDGDYRFVWAPNFTSTDLLGATSVPLPDLEKRYYRFSGKPIVCGRFFYRLANAVPSNGVRSLLEEVARCRRFALVRAMKPLALSLLVLLLVAAAPSLQAGPLQAGAAIGDITPKEWPLRLVGSFSERLADSVHDPLSSRALVLSDGKTTIAMVTVDNCLVKREVLDEAKSIASEKTGIPTENMLISATHTHSAPSTHATDESSAPEKAYRKLFIAKVADSIIQAHAALKPAQVGYGDSELPDEVFNRRWFLKPGTMPTNPFGEDTDIVKMNPGSTGLISPAGPIDPEVSILSVRTAKGQPLCLYGNYPLHYVGAVPRGQVSADYFGEFARLMAVRLRRSPEDGFVGIMSNGTSGDINNINRVDRLPPREPFEQIRLVASRVADSAYRAYSKTDHATDLPIKMVEREITLKMRKPDAEALERSRRYLATENEKELPRLAKAYAARLIRLHEGPDTVDLKIQAIRIGELSIVTLPFEVFAEIGLRLKEKSPFEDTFVVELANGALGYLPTVEQHEFGGYETWMGTCRVQKDANVILEKALFEMFAELKK